MDLGLKEKINTILNSDGVIAFVTDTVWGLGCLPSSEIAVKKIYEIKKREAEKPLILMSNSIENLKPYVKEINQTAHGLIEKYFPGALTLVLEKSEKTLDYMTSGFNTVGIRVPDNETFKEICESIDGHVLATTSANLSHEPSAKTYEQALKNIGKEAFVVNDFGISAKGLESTVALVISNEVKILRQGAIRI
jgi:L-threonylcarbamoyladenylate synthase